MIFGSDPESYIGRYGPCHYGNTVGVHHSHEGIGEKTINMDPAPAGIAEQHSPTINNPPNEPTQPSPVEYREKVQALHACKLSTFQKKRNHFDIFSLYLDQANPEDPNELNFSKGEILDIVDKTGNWWQARKADGTEGIIPSNYVRIFFFFWL